MAGPPTASFGEVTYYFQGANLPTYAACTLGLNDPANGFNDPTWQADFVQATVDLVQLTTPVSQVLQGMTIKVGPVDTGPTYNISVAEQGTLTGTLAGPQAAFLIRKQIDGVSTRLAGRLFWPGVTTGNIMSDGSVPAAALSVFQDAFDDYFNALVLLTSQPCVFNETSDPRDVTGFQVMPQIATQRRRNRR